METRPCSALGTLSSDIPSERQHKVLSTHLLYYPIFTFYQSRWSDSRIYTQSIGRAPWLLHPAVYCSPGVIISGWGRYSSDLFYGCLCMCLPERSDCKNPHHDYTILEADTSCRHRPQKIFLSLPSHVPTLKRGSIDVQFQPLSDFPITIILNRDRPLQCLSILTTRSCCCPARVGATVPSVCPSGIPLSMTFLSRLGNVGISMFFALFLYTKMKSVTGDEWLSDDLT